MSAKLIDLLTAAESDDLSLKWSVSGSTKRTGKDDNVSKPQIRNGSPRECCRANAAI